MCLLNVLCIKIATLHAEGEMPDSAASAPPCAPAAASAAAQGIELDEEAQLQLAMFLSLQEETEKAAKAASPPDATAPEFSQMAANRTAAVAAEELHSTQQSSVPVSTGTEPSGTLHATLTDTPVHQATAAAAAVAVHKPQHESNSAEQAELSGAAQKLQPPPGHLSQGMALLQKAFGEVSQPSQTKDQAPTSMLQPCLGNQQLSFQGGSPGGSIHSDLSSVGPAGSPLATDSDSDPWHYLDDVTQQSALPELSPAASTAPAANEAVASDVPVGQTIAESLRSMQSVHSTTSADGDSSAVRVAALPLEQFAALSLVDTPASNPDGEDQLQLETGNSQFLQYYFDRLLPQHSQTAANDHSAELDPFEAMLPLSSSPRAGGTVSEAAADESPFWMPDAAPAAATAGSEYVQYPEQFAQATPLSPRSQLHATALGTGVLGSSFTAAADHGAFVVDGGDSSEAVVGEHFHNLQATDADMDAPASIHVHQGDCLPVQAVHWCISLPPSMAL